MRELLRARKPIPAVRVALSLLAVLTPAELPPAPQRLAALDAGSRNRNVMRVLPYKRCVISLLRGTAKSRATTHFVERLIESLNHHYVQPGKHV